VYDGRLAIGTTFGVKLVDLISGQEIIYITGNSHRKQANVKNLLVVTVWHRPAYLYLQGMMMAR
jgi:hypothetical protein